MSFEGGSLPILDVNGHSLERLEKVFDLARGFPAEGFRTEGNNKFILYSYISDSSKATKFPTRLDAKTSANIVMQWLNGALYDKEPDHDGDNTRGWRCSTAQWGRIDGEWGSFLLIEPHWILYGK